MKTTVPGSTPRGTRPGSPPRPALDTEAIERIQREQEKAAEREFVRFAFYQVTPEWRQRPAETRAQDKAEFMARVEELGRKFMIYSYTLVGTRGDCDFMLWQASRDLDQFNELARAESDRTRCVSAYSVQLFCHDSPLDLLEPL